MSDLISRQAAIAATMETVFVEYEDGDPRKEESIILQTKAAIRDRIKALPPVYVPDTNDGNMISRQTAIDADDCINGVEEVLRSLPSAEPTITHCENCEHWDTSWETVYGLHYCPMIDMATKKNFFCKYGAERKGE